MQVVSRTQPRENPVAIFLHYILNMGDAARKIWFYFFFTVYKWKQDYTVHPGDCLHVE